MKGICFTEPLFHKVVKGEKTQTRRIINPQPTMKADWFIKEVAGWNAPFGVVEKYPDCEPEKFEIHQLLNPKYNIGEKVYLKEPYVISGKYIIYKFGSTIGRECDNAGVKWKNKLFMPESAARYFIEITGVKSERLQDISEEDCFKEGIEFDSDPNSEANTIGHSFGVKFPYNNGYANYTTPRKAYAALIDKINGKGTWERNPYVWVYDFKPIKAL